MKLEVSPQTFNELSVILKRQGRELNDGMPLQIEKGDAIMPPYDFRMVAIRQNCLQAAGEVFKLSPDRGVDNQEEFFLKTAEAIFNWCLNGNNTKETN